MTSFAGWRLTTWLPALITLWVGERVPARSPARRPRRLVSLLGLPMPFRKPRESACGLRQDGKLALPSYGVGEELFAPRCCPAATGQGLLEIGDDVPDILNAYRQAHEIGRDSRSGLLLDRELLVRSRGRMDYQRLGVAYICQQAEQFERVDQRLSGFITTADTESQ